MLERIKRSYVDDLDYSVIIQQLKCGAGSTRFSYTEGVLRRKGNIVIRNDSELREDTLKLFHGSTLDGHSGVTSTL